MKRWSITPPPRCARAGAEAGRLSDATGSAPSAICRRFSGTKLLLSCGGRPDAPWAEIGQAQAPAACAINHRRHFTAGGNSFPRVAVGGRQRIRGDQMVTKSLFHDLVLQHWASVRTTPPASERFEGGAGNDLFVAHAAQSTMVGHGGNDTFVAGTGVNQMWAYTDGYGGHPPPGWDPGAETF